MCSNTCWFFALVFVNKNVGRQKLVLGSSASSWHFYPSSFCTWRSTMNWSIMGASKPRKKHRGAGWDFWHWCSCRSGDFLVTVSDFHSALLPLGMGFRVLRFPNWLEDQVTSIEVGLGTWLGSRWLKAKWDSIGDSLALGPQRPTASRDNDWTLTSPNSMRNHIIPVHVGPP